MSVMPHFSGLVIHHFRITSRIPVEPFTTEFLRLSLRMVDVLGRPHKPLVLFRAFTRLSLRMTKAVDYVGFSRNEQMLLSNKIQPPSPSPKS